MIEQNTDSVVEMVGDKRRRAQIAERASDGRAIFEHPEQTERVKLWDNIEEAWTHNSFERNYAMQYHLQLYAVRCSACTFAETNQEAVNNHITSEQMKADEHTDAEIQPGKSPDRVSFMCTGCGAEFSAQGKARRQADSHLRRQRESLEQHANAEDVYPQVVRRYSLQPPVEPVSVAATPEVVPAEIQGEHVDNSN
jgi:hypothetical protein